VAAPAAAQVPAVQVPAVPTAGAAEPLEIRWVRRSAEHQALFLQVYGLATARVEAATAGRPPGTWAVVLDADETVISNLEYQAERGRAGLPFSRESWHAWVTKREATPLPGAAAFLARVHALGGRIAIVTNRLESECPDTEAVFRAHALVYDVMLCKPDQGPSDKNPRFDAVRNGTTPAGLPPLDVIAFLGDNIYDFPGMSQAVRERGPEAFADFGVRFFVLPNPMYGSWQ
jgi:5'-nucleotidase (lipoprotein e(P4) family)